MICLFLSKGVHCDVTSSDDQSANKQTDDNAWSDEIPSDWLDDKELDWSGDNNNNDDGDDVGDLSVATALGNSEVDRDIPLLKKAKRC